LTTAEPLATEANPLSVGAIDLLPELVTRVGGRGLGRRLQA
jgi:hypothetical protein